MEVLDPGWANQRLRFGIQLLHGEVCSQDFSRAIADVVSIRNTLKAAGAWWQAKKLDNWIHLAQKQGDYLARGAASTCSHARGVTPEREGEASSRSVASSESPLARSARSYVSEKVDQ